MKLYYLPGACSLADHIALEWSGARYEAVAVPRDQLKGEFLKINPLGSVPALALDDGSVLTQNAAILNYIADLHPEAGLGGERSSLERAQINRWIGFLGADLHPAFKPFFGATAYLEAPDAIARSKQHAHEQVRRLLALVDTHLQGQEWLVGTRSVADPYLYVMLRWAQKQQVDISGLDALAAFSARMDADPSVDTVLRAEGLR